MIINTQPNTPEQQRELDRAETVDHTGRTPGSWEVVETQGRYYIRRAGAQTGEMAVCQVMTGRKYTERNANANLLAASPDLYMACCEALDKFDEMSGQSAFAFADIRQLLTLALRKSRGDKA